MPFASSAASRISSNMSRSLFEAGPSVPMPTFDADLQHLRDRRDAGAELQVAGRVVRHAGVVILQRAHLAFVDVHAVRGQHLARRTGAASSPTARPACRGRAASPRLRAPSRRGGCAAARRTRPPARRTRAGSPACRCRARAAPTPGTISGWPCQRLDELAGARQRVLEARRVGRRENAAPSARTARACRRPRSLRRPPLRSSTCRRSRSRPTGSSRRSRASCRARTKSGLTNSRSTGIM